MITKNRIAELRAKHNMTQLELSYQTRISSSNISALEKGKVYFHPGWQKKIAEVFGVNESELFIRED